MSDELAEALLQENASDVQTLLDAESDPNAVLSDGSMPLVVAARVGDTGLVERLLRRGALLAAAEGWTALHWAASAGRDAAVAVLLDAGLEVNARDVMGNTPLLVAADEGHVGVVRVLLERGADIDAINDDGFTALMLAAVSNHTEAIQILVDAGAKIDMNDERGRTVLTWAARHGHITWATLRQTRDV
jgi:ankyrin repeat protein